MRERGVRERETGFLSLLLTRNKKRNSRKKNTQKNSPGQALPQRGLVDPARLLWRDVEGTHAQPARGVRSWRKNSSSRAPDARGVSAPDGRRRVVCVSPARRRGHGQDGHAASAGSRQPRQCRGRERRRRQGGGGIHGAGAAGYQGGGRGAFFVPLLVSSTLLCWDAPTLLPGPRKFESPARRFCSSHWSQSTREIKRGTLIPRAERIEPVKEDFGRRGGFVECVTSSRRSLNRRKTVFFDSPPVPLPLLAASAPAPLSRIKKTRSTSHRSRTCTAMATPGTTTRCFTMGSSTARGGSNLECAARTWRAEISGTATLSTATSGI